MGRWQVKSPEFGELYFGVSQPGTWRFLSKAGVWRKGIPPEREEAGTHRSASRRFLVVDKYYLLTCAVAVKLAVLSASVAAERILSSGSCDAASSVFLPAHKF
jgi:hypothetical protein